MHVCNLDMFFEVRNWEVVFGEKIFDKDPLAERDLNVAFIIDTV